MAWRLVHKKYRGDYLYTDDGIDSIRERNNSRSSYVYIANRTGSKPGKLGWQGLFTSGFRELPGSIYKSEDRSTQADEQALLGLNYRLKHKHSSSRWNTYYNTQVIRFKLNEQTAARVHKVYTVGGSYEYDRSWNSFLGSMTRIDLRHDNYNSDDASVHQKTTFGVVQQATITLSSRLTLIPVVRFSQEIDEIAWLTGEGIARYFAPGAGLLENLAFVWSKNLRRPGFNEYYWVPGGNPNLHDEESSSVSFKSSWRLPLHLNLGVEAVHTGYDYQIQWLPQPNGLGQAVNLDAAVTNSIVTHLDGVYWGGALELQVGYDYLATENLTAGLRYGTPFYYSPEHQFRFHITTTLTEHVQMVLNGAGYSRYYGAPFGQRPGAGKVDLHMHWNNIEDLLIRSRPAWPQLQLSLSIINITDERLEFRTGYPEPGRAVNITITLEQ